MESKLDSTINLLVDSNLTRLTIDDNLSINFVVVAKLNNNKESISFLFFFFSTLSKIFLLSIKKDVRQLFDAIIKIKTIRLAKQQLKTIYVRYNALEV